MKTAHAINRLDNIKKYVEKELASTNIKMEEHRKKGQKLLFKVPLPSEGDIREWQKTNEYWYSRKTAMQDVLNFISLMK